MKLIIIFPAHNEEKRIGKTLEEYINFFSKIKNKIEYKLIVVLNACKDNTRKVVEDYNRKELEIIEFERGGKGFAIKEGYKYALKYDSDLIGFADADLATKPEDFYELIKNIMNYEGVIASRWLPKSRVKRTFLKRITSFGFNFLVRSLFLLPYKDTQCGAKVFKRGVIEKITPELGVTEWAFDVDLLYLAKRNKFRIREYPTVWNDKGGSKIGNIPKTALQMFLGIFRLRLMYSFLEPLLKPVKFVLRLGHDLINKK